MIGKKKMAVSGIVSTALALSLVATMLPATAMAAEPQPKVDEKADSSLDNLVMNKSVKLEDNGTYTINLEAYAKGQVQTETQTEVKPADIILGAGSVRIHDKPVIITLMVFRQAATGQAGNLSIGDIMDGTYYVKDGDNYYRVFGRRGKLWGKRATGKVRTGNVITIDQISYSWKRHSDQREFEAASPFVTSSPKNIYKGS